MENKQEIIYLDNNNNIVDREKSTHFIIRELDDNNNLITESFGINDIKETEENETIELNEELYNYVKELGLIEEEMNIKITK